MSSVAATTERANDRANVGARSDRSAELVAAAIAVVAGGSLDALDAASVAREAGVSKALVYYYFPTHLDLQAAVLRSAAEDLLEAIAHAVTAAVPPGTPITAGLDAAVAYIERHPAAYVALARTAGYHPKLSEVFEFARDGVVDLMATAFGIDEPTQRQRIALRSWIALAEEAVLHWIVADRPIERSEIVDYCRAVAEFVATTPLAR